MRNAIAIAKREIQSYIVSPIAYLVIAAFLLLASLYFGLMLGYMIDYRQAPSVRDTVMFMVLIFVFAVPFLTMRLLAQEQRLGTLELMFTSPVGEWEFVLGKFIAGMALLLMMVLPTLLFPITLEILGNPDWGPIWSAYIGLLFVGSVLVSVGLFASALTENQIIAAVISLALNLVLWIFLEAPAYSPNTNPLLAEILRFLALRSHFEPFATGALDTRDVVYCLSMVILFLFTTIRVLEARRWRG